MKQFDAGAATMASPALLPGVGMRTRAILRWPLLALFAIAASPAFAAPA